MRYSPLKKISLEYLHHLKTVLLVLKVVNLTTSCSEITLKIKSRATPTRTDWHLKDCYFSVLLPHRIIVSIAETNGSNFTVTGCYGNGAKVETVLEWPDFVG